VRGLRFGRVGLVDLSGFDGIEVGFDRLDRLWLRGGFPESFLSDAEEASLHGRQQFIRTFLTRDIPQLGITVPSEQLHRFWLMIAHYQGQTWNASKIGGSLGINYKTAQHCLDILTGAFMIRSLPPWTGNLGKRVRKAPKIYLRDSGLFHALQRIHSLSELRAHPKLGASWKGLALEHVLRVLRVEPGEVLDHASRWSNSRAPSHRRRMASSRRAELSRTCRLQATGVYPCLTPPPDPEPQPAGDAVDQRAGGGDTREPVVHGQIHGRRGPQH